MFSKGNKAFQSRITSLLKFEALLIEMSSVFHMSTAVLKYTLIKDIFASKICDFYYPNSFLWKEFILCVTQIVITGFDKITASLREPHSLLLGAMILPYSVN